MFRESRKRGDPNHMAKVTQLNVQTSVQRNTQFEILCFKIGQKPFFAHSLYDEA